MGFKENLETLRPIGEVEMVLLNDAGGNLIELLNVDGKRGSLQVYLNVLNFEDGEIGPYQAWNALDLFAEYTQEARDDQNKHPNIQRLFPVAYGYDRPIGAIISYK